MSTWSKARDTFGEGVPQTGERFDQSGPLNQLKTTVDSAAPGSTWSGTAASAYGKANTDHGNVIGQMAGLDQRLGAQVTQAANIVQTGRRNLDAIRQWVLDAAGSVPAGKNREQLLLPIAQKGLGQVQDVITTSNSQLNAVGVDVKKVGGEYDALGNQKFGPKDGPDLQGVKGDDDKKDLRPEDMEDLVHKAVVDGDQQSADKVRELLNGITPEQLGPNSNAHPLDPVQAELVGQMQAQMKGMSMEDLNGARDRLGANKDILANGLQVMSNPNVSYPRHDGDGAEVVPANIGYPLPNRGVLPGDTGALPDGVQNTLNQGGHFLGPPEPTAGYPGSQTDLEGSARESAADNMKSLANIVGDGDQRFQQGTALDRGMMSNAKDWLSSQASPDGQKHWGDDVVQRVFETAGHDTVVDHDMFTSDKSFTHDVLTHEWQDDGKSARTLTDWIPQTAHSDDPLVNARAGETASALADYLGDPANKQTLMDITTASHPNMSMGQLNPELTQSLAQAMSPYVDEMAGRDLDGTSGWHAIDGKSDLSYPHAANVFAALGTDSGAATILDTRSATVQQDFINQYANSVISHDGPVDGAAMEAAGRLKGITDQGAFLSELSTHSDEAEARKAAYERLSANYDLAKDMAGFVPTAGPALTLHADLMKEAILGPPPPGSADTGQTPIESSEAMKSALASTFMAQGFGDPASLAAMQHYLGADNQLQIPGSSEYDRLGDAYQNSLDQYLGGMGASVTESLDTYDEAYRDVIR
jgi:hypothetical protein